MTVQFRWPLSMPLVENIGSGIWEVRSKLPTRTHARCSSFTKARSSFYTDLLRRPGKLQRKTGLWLWNGKMPTSKAARTKNKHRGSSFESFLKKEGLHEQVQAIALKRAIAMKLNDLMKQKRVNKSVMAAEMRTSRAAIHRLLDPENTSVTLATLNRAARSLGRKVKIELVAA